MATQVIEYYVSPEERQEAIVNAARQILIAVGEDPEREGLVDTPSRFARALDELTCGYQQDPAQILARTFAASSDEMIVVRDIPFSSLCEHHMLSFIGSATVAYIPSEAGKVVGLSKIPRLVDCFARRLQIQEQLTTQIADAMMTHLAPRGVGVVVKAVHQCMALRGVNKQAEMVTSALLGCMREGDARAEFMMLAHGKS